MKIHDKQIHRNIYRIPDGFVDMSEVSRLLQAAMGDDEDDEDDDIGEDQEAKQEQGPERKKRKKDQQIGTANLTKMTNLDSKIAVSLLPVLDDTEETTNKLIDAFELYESMLNNDGKPQLIKFVLKTRLSNAAKLRLNTSYGSVDEL